MSKTWRRVLDPNTKVRDMRTYGNETWKIEAQEELEAMDDTFYIIVNLYAPADVNDVFDLREDLSFWRNSNAAYEELREIAKELGVELGPDDEDFYAPTEGSHLKSDYYYIEEAEFSG